MSQIDFKTAFEDLQILVIGDAMIDRYFYGKVNRQSPEAAVPIIDVAQVENRLGGAANVALNIARLGAKAHLMTFNGSDNEAPLMKELLQQEGICFKLVDSDRRTTIKTRLYNQNTYAMRYDMEDVHAISAEELEKLLANIAVACEKVPLNAVVLQDYNKGLFTEESIKAIISLVNSYNIPIAVDPKEANFFAFQNVALFKPNLKEVNRALGIHLNGEEVSAIQEACTTLKSKLDCKAVLLTLAHFGAVAADQTGFYTVAAHERDVVDVSGAGDTVIAMASLLLGMKMPIQDVLHYSNLAGGLVIEERGVKALRLSEWQEKVS